mmetsp:Transcript_63030/g.72307  ORF Transcript_63030/g.72307 Transcript_63030/m.72307 type:complete len:327 (+) Transcript_63030:100-1080(+)
MKIEDVNACQFENWYSSFKKHTFKSKIIHLDEEIVNFLNSDDMNFGKALPEDDEWANNEEETKEGEKGKPIAERFPGLNQTVSEILEEFGSAFPKLNWSSPRDATWVSPLRCFSLEDIFLLLKSSDFITHDLTEPYEHCEDLGSEEPQNVTSYTLVLRKHYSLKEGMEFRCFVKEGELIAISQRDCSKCYDFLLGLKSTIKDNISELFEDTIKSKFPLIDYTFDIYIDIPPNYKPRIIDFGPYGLTTDFLLFTNEEVDNLTQVDDEKTVTLKLVEEDNGVKPSDLNMYRVPVDFLDMKSQNMQEFFDKVQKGQALQSDSDEEKEDS